MKKQELFIIASFLSLITILGVLTFLLPQKKYSENENRYLQTMPDITIHGIVSGDVQKEFDRYLSDQFPGRDFFTAGETKTKKLFGRKDVGGVYIGDKGYYFEKVNENDIEFDMYVKNLGRLEKFAQRFPKVPVSVMLVPSAGTILSDQLPPYAALYDADKMYRSAASTLKSCNFLDLRKTLSAEADQGLYYKTDHHWTTRGAYLGFCAFLEQKGISPLKYEDAGFKTVTNKFYGTLYSKALDSDAVPDSIELSPVSERVTATADGKESKVYDWSALEKKDKYKVFFGGNYGEVILTGGCKNGKTLLIIKDSFANCFAPLLCDDYETVIMIDLRYFSGTISSAVKNQSVNEVLFLYEISNFANDGNLVKLLIN